MTLGIEIAALTRANKTKLRCTKKRYLEIRLTAQELNHTKETFTIFWMENDQQTNKTSVVLLFRPHP